RANSPQKAQKSRKEEQEPTNPRSFSSLRHCDCDVCRRRRSITSPFMQPGDCVMLVRHAAFCCCILVCSAKLTCANDEFEVHGRVVDQQRRPVAEVSIATNWSANGQFLKADGTPIYDLADPDQQRVFDKQLGKMEPLSHRDQRTDASGRFSIKVHSRATIV